jgi:ATP-dependent protease HslVU (ClpYQ) peptidase subunit
MTCIVGFAQHGRVYIGGDSAGVAGYQIQIRADEKVFHNGPFLMGFTTSFRMGQLLRYDFKPPEHPEGMDDMKFMVSVFIPEVKKCLKDGCFQKTKDGQDHGGSFLVGYRGALYEIDDDYQVGKLSDNIASVGCGANVALGAMYALDHYHCPIARIRRSLEITTHLNSGVRPPFVILEV